MTEFDDRQDEIDTDAARWVARLNGGPLDVAERRQFDAWLNESPRHAAAFDEAQRAWSRMDEVAHAPGDLLRDIPPAVAAVSAPVRRPLWGPALVLAACLLVAVAGVRLWFGDPAILLAADYRTEPGERRLVTLPDASVVELGPDSAIALHYTDRERRVELLSGLAYFIAAPRQGAEGRPFVVEAAMGTARALGTQFVVDRFLDSVEVTVIEHEVEVAVAADDGRRPQVVLSPGESVRYAKAGLMRLPTAMAEQAASWRRDRLFFDRVTLDHVVAELNRYRRGRIVIATSSLASRRVSGVFDTADPDAALATIARELGVRIVSAPLVTLLY